MKVIEVRNVNEALDLGIHHLLDYGVAEPSRNGPVLVAPTPVTTAYTHPWERVLFSPMRDANPFFHVMEALWMLAGRNDLTVPKEFNSKFGLYSDDGETVRGAYGHRWRRWFGYDQLRVIIEELKANPASRRCVLAMWDAQGSNLFEKNGAEGDLLATTVDKPCNTHIYFRVNQGKLDMTVCCRSNDILWGAYGANVVHMSFLQEYVANSIGVGMGVYYQISNNYHLYTEVPIKGSLGDLAEDADRHNHYLEHNLKVMPLVRDPVKFDEEVVQFFDDPGYGSFTEPFLVTVARPMYQAWRLRKEGRNCRAQLTEIQSHDWQRACMEWVNRRDVKRG